MPIYEFVCEDCQHEFEQLVFRRDEEVECPECQSENAKRLLSAFAVTGDARLASSASCGSCKPTPGKCSGCGSH